MGASKQDIARRLEIRAKVLEVIGDEPKTMDELISLTKIKELPKYISGMIKNNLIVFMYVEGKRDKSSNLLKVYAKKLGASMVSGSVPELCNVLGYRPVTPQGGKSYRLINERHNQSGLTGCGGRFGQSSLGDLGMMPNW